MRAIQFGAIVTFSVLIALMGVLEILIPSWIGSAQWLATDLTILFGACLIASIISVCLTKPNNAWVIRAERDSPYGLRRVSDRL